MFKTASLPIIPEAVGNGFICPDITALGIIQVVNSSTNTASLEDNIQFLNIVINLYA